MMPERPDTNAAVSLPPRFATTADRVERALLADLDAWLTVVPARLAEAIRYALLGPGKRVRPVLLLWSAELCGGAASAEAAMPAAVAIEMLHTYSLVHDDLPAMDDDDLRRGRATCHVAYDEATAILVGDALLTRAFEVIGRSGLPADRVVRLIAALGQAAGAGGMIGGQAEDLAHEHAGGDLATVDYIHEHKTAALLAVACRMGAIAAGGDAIAEQSFATFGRAVGLAFQIADDLLDEVGQTDELGKQAGKDRAAGKLTYPAVVGLDGSRVAARQWIERADAELESSAARGADRNLLDDFRRLARYVIERSR